MLDKKPTPEKEEKKVSPSVLLKIISKNMLSLPGMARDMNVARQNAQKLVTLMGGEKATKADAHWLKTKQRTEKLGVEAKKEENKIVPEPEKKEKGKPSLIVSLKQKGLDKVKDAGKNIISDVTDLFTGIVEVITQIFAVKVFMSVISKLALPVLILTTIWQGFKGAWDAYQETGSIWEAVKSGVGQIVEFFTFGFVDKKMVGEFMEQIPKFFKPIVESVTTFFGKISDWFSEKFEAIKDFFVGKKQPKAPEAAPQKFPGAEQAMQEQRKASEEESRRRKEENARKKKEEADRAKAQAEADATMAREAKQEEARKKKEAARVAREKAEAAKGKPTPAPAPAAAPAAAPTPEKKEEKPLEVSGVQAVIVNTLNESGITSPKAQSNVLATVKAESNFKVQSENLNFSSPERIQQVFGKRRIPSIEFAEQFVKNPEALANHVYKTTDGNSEPGDGYKYRGRGFIQHTGKNQYSAIAKFTGVDVLKNPDELNSPIVAAKAIPWFLLSYKRMKPEDVENMSKVNRAIAFSDPTGKKAKEREESAEKIYASMSGSQGTQIASASAEVSSGQRQQQKPMTPVVIDASKTNNTTVQNNRVVAEKKTTDHASTLTSRATA